MKQMIYVGPSLGAMLPRFSCFQGEFPPHVSQLIEKYPTLEKLFVPADQLAAARRDMTDPGSLLRIHVRKFLKERSK